MWRIFLFDLDRALHRWRRLSQSDGAVSKVIAVAVAADGGKRSLTGLKGPDGDLYRR
jgi:hypothetical protein